MSPYQCNISNGGPIRSIVMHATIDMETFLFSRDCCLWTSIDLVSRVWKSPSVDVRVCLATDSFWLEDWVRIGKLREKHVRVYTVNGEDSRSSGLVQVSDGLYAEVLLWCASGPIAQWWIVPACVWRLSDCKNVSSCWKIATRGPVGRILLELVFRDRTVWTCMYVLRVADCVQL
jgi:hypothetical protein